MNKAVILACAAVVVIVGLLVVLQAVLFPRWFTPSSANTDTKIAACYPAQAGCAACQPILNNSTQRVVPTTRLFVNVPKDLYPQNINSFFTTARGNATAGYVSNGGPPGLGMNATPDCWSTYFEFGGEGEVDLTVKSTQPNTPDYVVRFMVGPP